MLYAAICGHDWGLGAGVGLEVVYTVRVRACLLVLSAMGYI